MIDLNSNSISQILTSIIKSIFIFLLLLFFLGCNTKSKSRIYPPEKFSALESHLANGKPVIGSVNMAYKSYNQKDEYPWCLEINMALDTDSLYKNGLPLKSESNIASKYEDKLIKHIKTITTAHYIGHMYNDTFLDIYIYMDKPEKVNDYLQEEVNRKGAARPFAYKITKDADWLVVKPFLK